MTPCWTASAARAAGFGKIRLNAVLLRNVNGAHLAELVGLAAHHDCELRFIELMPFGEGAAIYDAEYLSGDEALESLQGSFKFLARPPTAPPPRGIASRLTARSGSWASSPPSRIPSGALRSCPARQPRADLCLPSHAAGR